MSELPTNSKTAGREHFVRTNSELPMPVGTSDAMKELPTSTNFCSIKAVELGLVSKDFR